MFELTVKFTAVLLLFAVTGCGEPEYEYDYDPADTEVEERVGPVEPADPAGREREEAEIDIPEEAAIDIVAHSSHLSVSLHEKHPEDPEAMNREYEEKLKEVAAGHNLELAEIDMRELEEYVMQNPEILREIQDRVMQMQGRE